VFRTSRASATGFTAADSIGVVIVSIETGAPGTAPSENRIIWGRRSERLYSVNTATPIGITTQGDSAPIKFGTFKPRRSEEYVYTYGASATYTAAVNLLPPVTLGQPITPRGRVEVRGPILVMNDSNYMRPPLNYYYAAWAIKLDSLNKTVDTVYMGRRTT